MPVKVPLKTGDVLFQIDPRPFQYVVDQKKALLAEADQNVGQLKASFEATTAAAIRGEAQYQLAKANYDRQMQLFQKQVIAQTTLDTTLAISRLRDEHWLAPMLTKNAPDWRTASTSPA